jgi:thiosulfate reductase cytochrome b subunit
VYDWLLFLHLLAAFLLAVTIVMYSAVALGATSSPRMLFVADRCWDVGGLGTLIFGIWLALNLDQYDFFDGWILLALFLWFVATGLGQRVQRRIGGDDIRSVIALPWIRTIVVIGLLVTMIWKPGA